MENDQHMLGGDARDVGYGSGDFGGKARGLGFWMAVTYPSADQNRTCRYAVGVDAVGGQLVKTMLTFTCWARD